MSQNPFDLSLIDEIHQALADPSDYCAQVVTDSHREKKLTRRALAPLSLACAILGLRSRIEVDAQQLRADLERIADVNDALVLLEMLYAYRQIDALIALQKPAMERWSGDVRIYDVIERAHRALMRPRFSLCPEAYVQQYAVLDFSYTGFTHFARAHAGVGSYSINLGDYMQSEAVRLALIRLGIDGDRIRYLDRDNTSETPLQPTCLITNGVFYPSTLDPRDSVHRLYFGFSFHPKNMHAWETPDDYINATEHLPKNALIGCRDEATAAHLGQLGFHTYVTGCLSQSLPARAGWAGQGRTVICGIEDSPLKAKLLSMWPDAIVLADQRHVMSQYPLLPETRSQCREAARALIEFYRLHAGRVVTSLLHCAGPAAAMGIPTFIVRPDPENIRFSAIRHHLTVARPEEATTLLAGPDPLGLFQTLSLADYQLDLLEATIELDLITRQPR